MRARNVLTLSGLVAMLALTGCTTTSQTASADKSPASKEAKAPVVETAKVETNKIFNEAYGATTDAGYALPAIPINKVKEQFHRQIVDYQTSEPAGTIVVDTPNRFLYYVMPGGKAVRYGISVGKAGFAWQGEAYIAWKQQWPSWHPPKEMAARKPEVAKYVENGMEGGLKNPLGARAMYLFDDKGRDTLFRLHGTPEWSSIGTAASSGCIRLINQDVIDLYERVRPGRGARVVVLQ